MVPTSVSIQSLLSLECIISFCSTEPTDIDPTDLTHILYSFADVSADTGTISLTDSYADEQVCCVALCQMSARILIVITKSHRNISQETPGPNRVTTSTGV